MANPTAANPGDPGPRVSETSVELGTSQVGPDGRVAPSTTRTSPAATHAATDSTTRGTRSRRSSPMPSSISRVRARQFVDPLVAQNHTYTRYESGSTGPVRGHRRERLEGPQPAEAGQPADLPMGSNSVKASWRILTDADTPAVRRATTSSGHQCRRCRKEPRRRQDRLLEERHRPGRHARHRRDRYRPNGCRALRACR